MGHFLERLRYFTRPREGFSDDWGEVRQESRQWEDGYRNRWSHDKIVRSTHGVNCTGSCSWKIHVKQGIVTWEAQQTDYPRTRPDMPNHEPRGCARGASYSWYLYSANRLKYPMVRARLIRHWRELRKTLGPVEAWEALAKDPGKKDYKTQRGRGGFVRVSWQEALELVAAANVDTVRRHGPDRVVGFSPIPAMSMVSYASGARYLSLIGGTLLSFYDWYCDLPPSSPQTWGEQTDVSESADWYNSGYLIAWGSNVPQTRTPDAHFFVEARYNGTQVVAVTPDYAEVAKLSDRWLHPKQGTDAAMAMAMGHVILKEFFLDRQAEYFQDYCKRYTDLPLLVTLRQEGDAWVADRYLRASDFDGCLGSPEKADWKTVAFDAQGKPVVPQGSMGFRWADKEGPDHGKWNLETKAADGSDLSLQLTQLEQRDDSTPVAFAYFGGTAHPNFTANAQQGDVLLRHVPTRRVSTVDGEVRVATAFDLLCAHYGLDRGLGGTCAASYEDDIAYTPAWQEQITGVPAAEVIAVARGFADNAEKTRGRSMVIIGAGMNHWYHQDMNYRSIINFLMLCGTVGVSGGGWAHYVGQEKLRPQTGWTALAFALDWVRPPRQMAGTSFFYAHSDQWRYETLRVGDLLSPLADKARYGRTLLDCNVRAERMGWTPSAPQLNRNPLEVAREAQARNMPVRDYVAQALQSGQLAMACEDPDNPVNFPRCLFIWRSNLFGSSGKGHEYFLRHFLGTAHGVQGEEISESQADARPEEVVWHEQAPEGKLDLVVTLDFRMSTSCLYSDVVLPTASWYEKNDLNTSDMHPFIHPLSAAVDPVYESRSDWEIFKALAAEFSRQCPGKLGVEQDVVLSPILHDTAGELAQPKQVADWKKGECELVPGVTAPNITLVERDYPATLARYTALGPLMDTLGNGGKGIQWNTQHEVEGLGALNRRVQGGPADGRPRINSDIDAAETVLYLAPETNGEVAVKAWQALSDVTGRDHTHLAAPRAEEKIRFRDIQAQPRKIISSPTWSGIESEHVSYSAG
ncbi:nitrate reductase subunit alpha [Castellaniella caeni]